MTSYMYNSLEFKSLFTHREFLSIIIYIAVLCGRLYSSQWLWSDGRVASYCQRVVGYCNSC